MDHLSVWKRIAWWVVLAGVMAAASLAALVWAESPDEMSEVRVLAVEAMLREAAAPASDDPSNAAPAPLDEPEPHADAAPDAKTAARSLDTLLETIRARHDLPALGGAIIRGREVVAIGATGLRRAGGAERVTTDDLWHIGSCTKAMTALLCARLVEEGKLRWDSTLGELFPSLESMHESYRAVTLEQLLTNRAGVPTSLDAGGLWGRLWTFSGPPTDARRLLLRGVTSRAPEAEPGTKFIYSNGGFSLAGLMAEEVTGRVYEDLMQELVFAPLGITTTGFGAPGQEDTAAAATQPWGHRPDGNPVTPGPRADNPPGIAPASRVHLSMHDWARYISAHLRGDPSNPNHEPTLVSAETWAILHTPKEGRTGPGSDYACGWARPSRPWGGADGTGGHVLTHSGSNTMWFAVTWIAPQRDFAVLVVCNHGGDKAVKACDEAVGALMKELESIP